VTLLVKDDHSSVDGARAAAQAALNEGAELIIGPLFAANTKEVGRLARGAGKPVIAFSTDTSAAARGVYLLSFLVESYVDRIIGFASQRGKKSIAALVPESDYGTLALGEFQSAAARYGMRVQGIERYSPATLTGAVERIAALGEQIDTLFIPEQAEAMGAVSQQLIAKGVDPKKIQILGTGIWNDARVLRLPVLQGAWFSAPENAGFNAFATRYRAKFNSDPTRISTLAYDAVSLAVALSRSQGSQRFSDQVLLNNSGFNGADGVFRFKPDGQNDRGLSVLQIGNGTTTVLSPAPRSFAGSPNGT
jgi:ABC-type branched-subunit amino acid transport system substrate-binding protein